MAPLFFFSETIEGSSFAEPNGKTHLVEVFEGEGNFLLRVETSDGKTIDLLFTREQAAEFANSVDECLARCGIAR